MRHSPAFLALATLVLTTAGCNSENDAKQAGAADEPSTSVTPTRDAEPADEVPAQPVALADGVTLEPGVPAYDEFRLSTGGTVRVDLTTPAEGWFAHAGDPQRGLNVGPEREWTGLLWYEATGVVSRPCGDAPLSEEDVVPMSDSLRPLLREWEWVTVVRKPRAEQLGGREAQHAVLILRACDGGYPNPIATGGDSGPLPGGEEFDLWLVPLPEADTAMVVFDPTGDGSDALRQQWQQVVDSLEITVQPASA